jgi:hypothetical protein
MEDGVIAWDGVIALDRVMGLDGMIKLRRARSACRG